MTYSFSSDFFVYPSTKSPPSMGPADSHDEGFDQEALHSDSLQAPSSLPLSPEEVLPSSSRGFTPSVTSSQGESSIPARNQMHPSDFKEVAADRSILEAELRVSSKVFSPVNSSPPRDPSALTQNQRPFSTSMEDDLEEFLRAVTSPPPRTSSNPPLYQIPPLPSPANDAFSSRMFPDLSVRQEPSSSSFQGPTTKRVEDGATSASEPDLIVVETRQRTSSRFPPSVGPLPTAPLSQHQVPSSSFREPVAKRRRVENEAARAPIPNHSVLEIKQGTSLKIEKLSKLIKSYFMVASPLNLEERREISRIAIARANLSRAEINQLYGACLHRLRLYNPPIYEDVPQVESALNRLIAPTYQHSPRYHQLTEWEQNAASKRFLRLQDIFLENVKKNDM